MKLGEGFAAAVQNAGNGASNELASIFERALSQIGKDLQAQLDEDLRLMRAEMIAEVRAEIARVESSETVDKLCEALTKIGTPQVHVAAPNVTVSPPNVEVLPADVTVNTPKPDAPKVTVEARKHIELLRDADGKITGANVS